MAAKRWNGVSTVTLTTAERWDGTTMIPLTIAKRWDGTAFIDMGIPGIVITPVVVTVQPGVDTKTVFDSEPAPNFITITTDGVVANPSGGDGNYTFLWTKKSGSSAIIADTPTSSMTTFHALIGKQQTLSAVYTITATDGLGAFDEADVTVNISYETDL